MMKEEGKEGKESRRGKKEGGTCSAGDGNTGSSAVTDIRQGRSFKSFLSPRPQVGDINITPSFRVLASPIKVEMLCDTLYLLVLLLCYYYLTTLTSLILIPAY